MDTNSQWPQIYEAENNNNNNNKNNNKKAILVRPNIKEQAALNCPRCNSTHTKFCYYNNYSLSQPRYLCKTCKRYWTEGGNLRNVPVGGGSRNNKTKRLPSSSKKSNLSPPRILITPTQNPSRTNNIIDHGQTLNLDFNPPASSCHGMSEFGVLPFGLNFKNLNPHENPNFCSASGVFTTAASLVSMPPVAPSHPSVFSSSSFGGGFKPSLSFSLDNHQGYSGNNNNLEGVQENTMIATSSRVAAAGFPPLDQEMMIKPFDHGHGGSNGYWHGMINDGGSW